MATLFIHLDACILYQVLWHCVVAASFIRVVGSEFVQKYLGEGPRMVRDVFRLARENAPAIIFIDEIDAIATKRFDAQTGGVYYVFLYRLRCICFDPEIYKGGWI